eukprot:gene18313-23999_t
MSTNIIDQTLIESLNNYYTKDGIKFGKQLRNKHFLLDPTYNNLNHGSFGTIPRPVLEKQNELVLLQESNPDKWFRETIYTLSENSRVKLAELVNADVNDLVLVENASSAVNSILRTLNLQKGDKVLYLSTAYGMVIDTLKYIEKTQSITIIIVPLPYPLTNSQIIVDLVQRTLQEYSLGNCHKWIYSPKGTAFLWVHKGLRTDIFPSPSVISSSGKYDYIGRYTYTGTRDYTAFGGIVAGLDFYNYLGGYEQIYNYNHNLIIIASKILIDAWKTGFLIDESMVGFMSNIILPTNNYDAMMYMQKKMESDYHTYIVVGSVESNDKKIYFIRLSGQVYLELDDFITVKDLIPKLLNEFTS